MYQVIVFIHVLSAIVAVGYNATYAVWLARGAMHREHLLFVLQGIKFMDDRIANPAYALLLVTGALQVHFSGRSWREPWIEWALGLYVLLVIVAAFGYSPALKRQIAMLKEHGPDDPQYLASNSRQTFFGIVLMVIVLVVIWLMVARPGGA